MSIQSSPSQVFAQLLPGSQCSLVLSSCESCSNITKLVKSRTSQTKESLQSIEDKSRLFFKKVLLLLVRFVLIFSASSSSFCLPFSESQPFKSKTPAIVSLFSSLFCKEVFSPAVHFLSFPCSGRDSLSFHGILFFYFDT